MFSSLAFQAKVLYYIKRVLNNAIKRQLAVAQIKQMIYICGNTKQIDNTTTPILTIRAVVYRNG